MVSLLEKGFDPSLLRANVPTLKDKNPEINEVCKVRIDLLSQKDICTFCRGFMSFLLGQNEQGESWFKDRLDKFLRGLPVELSNGKEYNACTSLGVEVYASSIVFSTKD